LAKKADIKKLQKDSIPESPESKFFDNLAEAMGDDSLESISSELIKGFESDKASLTSLNEMRKEYQKLNDMTIERRTDPWEGASNLKMPSITKPCVNFQSRASLNLFADGKVTKVIPGKQDVLTKIQSKRVEKYMNHQFNFLIPEFYNSFDKTLYQLALDGHAFRKVFYDPIIKEVVSDYILPQDFVVEYNTKHLFSSQRYTHVLHKTQDEMIKLMESGVYLQDDDVLSDISQQEIDTVTLEAKKNIGQSPPSNLDHADVRDVLEIHTSIKLSQEDKFRMPAIVTIDLNTRKVLRLVRRVNPKTGDQLNYFINYEFIPNPNSIFGYGFGMLLLGIGKSINTAINDFHNASHLSNIQGGWIAKGASQVKKGKIKGRQGEFKEMNVRGDDIRKSIMPYVFKGPEQSLIQLVNIEKAWTEELTTVTDLFSGVAPKSDTTATGAALAAEFGAKTFTSIQLRIHRKFQEELKIIKEFNAIFTDKDKYINITSDINEEIFNDLTQEEKDQLFIQLNLDAQIKDASGIKINPLKDFEAEFSIIPASDPTIISNSQRIQNAEALAQVIAQNPFLAQDPAAHQLVMRQRLEAVNEKEETIIALEQTMGQAVQAFQAQQALQVEQARQLEEAQAAEQEQQSTIESLDRVSQEELALEQVEATAA